MVNVKDLKVGDRVIYFRKHSFGINYSIHEITGILKTKIKTSKTEFKIGFGGQLVDYNLYQISEKEEIERKIVDHYKEEWIDKIAKLNKFEKKALYELGSDILG